MEAPARPAPTTPLRPATATTPAPPPTTTTAMLFLSFFRLCLSLSGVPLLTWLCTVLLMAPGSCFRLQGCLLMFFLRADVAFFC